MSAPTTPDIRDIRPLISIAPWWYALAPVLAAVLLLALAFAAKWYWDRRKARMLTPEQRAEQALLRAEALARAGESRQWASLVADTLRGALAARLGRTACPETTQELSTVDWSTNPEARTLDAPELVAILSICDMTRFALGQLEPSALLLATQGARDWVKRLFAVPEATTAHAEGSPS